MTEQSPAQSLLVSQWAIPMWFFKRKSENSRQALSSLVNIFSQANKHLLGPFPPSTYYSFERKLWRFSVKKNFLKDNGYFWWKNNIVFYFISVHITNSGAFHSSLDLVFLPSSFPPFFTYFYIVWISKGLMWLQNWSVAIFSTYNIASFEIILINIAQMRL